MAKASKRPPTSASVSQNALSGATSALQGLPDRPKATWSLREAVSVLQESISEALSKGYSYDEIAALLSKHGVSISSSSLKSYLSAAKRQKGIGTTRGRKRGRRSKATEPIANLNGSAPVTSIATAKAKKTASTGSSKTTKSTTQRKPKAEAPTKTAAKAKPVAKTTRKAVTNAKAASKPTGRGRKKSS